MRFIAVIGAVAACLAIGGAVNAPLSMHARLEESRPAAGDTLQAPLDSVWLRFSAAVEAPLTELSITTPLNATLLLEADHPGDDDRIITAAMPPLPAGAHTLAWRTVSADGHALNGTIAFTVSESAVTARAPAASASVQQQPITAVAASDDTADDDDAAPRAAPFTLRTIATTFLLALVGVLVFATFGTGDSLRLHPLVTGLALATPLLLAADLGMWLYNTTGSLDVVAAAGTASGRPLLIRLLLATIALFAWTFARRPALAGIAAAAALLAGAAVGHAAAHAPALSMPLKALHLAAAALWLGGLLVLLFSLRTVADPATVRRVSRGALIAVLAIAITGIAQLLILLPEWSALYTTRYGQLAIAKTAGLLLLVAFGAVHRTMVARVETAGVATTLRRSVGAELLVMLGVLVLAGALAFTPVPLEQEAAASSMIEP